MIGKILACFRKPSSDNVSHDAEDKYALHSGERQVGLSLTDIRYDHRVRYGKVAEIMKNINNAHSMLGLDMFCANGYGSYIISSALNCCMFGIDACSEAINHATKYYSNSRTFYVNKEFPFNLPRSVFDFVVCMESIEHVIDYADMLNELANCLKDDGCLFISTPNENILSLSLNPNMFHRRHYTRFEMEHLVKASGSFDLIKWYGQDIYELNEGKVCNCLKDDEMKLSEGVEGQFIVYVFKKHSNVNKSPGCHEL